jgi:hypothetical protein
MSRTEDSKVEGEVYCGDGGVVEAGIVYVIVETERAGGRRMRRMAGRIGWKSMVGFERAI